MFVRLGNLSPCIANSHTQESACLSSYFRVEVSDCDTVEKIESSQMSLGVFQISCEAFV